MIIVRLFRSLVLCLSTFNPLSVIKSITMHVWRTEESGDGEAGEHAHGLCFQPRNPGKRVLGACSCLPGIEVSPTGRRQAGPRAAVAQGSAQRGLGTKPTPASAKAARVPH